MALNEFNLRNLFEFNTSTTRVGNPISHQEFIKIP